MSDILAKINGAKQAQVDATLGNITEGRLAKGPGDVRVPKDFMGALRGPKLSVIAEVKKASPSKGVIREDFDPVWIAQRYAEHGAACLSVLTETDHFQGSIEIFKSVRQAVDLPLLRKDFMVDYRQVRESYEMGADAILLILASLDDAQMARFFELAQGFGLSVLAEVHDLAELERAKALGLPLIGVNNRNLKTFKTSLQTSHDLLKEMPPGAVKVSESGINHRQDCQMLAQAGFEAVLVGESLMRQPDPGLALSELTKGL